MTNQNIKAAFGFLLGLSLVLTGCGSDGGQKIQLTDTSASSRAADAKAQTAIREANDRAADAKINGRGPNTTIRTGDARSNSMDGSNPYLSNSTNTLPSSTNPSASASKGSDKSAYLLVGLTIAGLFGKQIVSGGADAVKAVKDEVKGAFASNGKEEKSSPPSSTEAKLSSEKSSSSPADNGPKPEESGPRQAVRPKGAGDGVADNRAAPPVDAKLLDKAKALASAQCSTSQKSSLNELDKFLSDVSKKTSEPGVKS